MAYREVVEWLGVAVDVAGVLTIVCGIIVSLVAFGGEVVRRRLFPDAYRALRHAMGRSILLGLELLVAADIIRTVAIEPTLENVAVLGVIVAVRTFLSFSLEVELEGRWPWRRSEAPQPR